MAAISSYLASAAVAMTTIDKLGLTFVAALVTLAALGGRAAQDRAIPSPDRISELSVRPVIDLNGTIAAFVVKAKFVTIDARPDGTVDSKDIGSVEFDMAKNDNSVVVGDDLYDYREIMNALMAASTREWEKANPRPLPQRRRALRVK